MVLASWVALLVGRLLAGIGPVVPSMVWPRRYERLAAAAVAARGGPRRRRARRDLDPRAARRRSRRRRASSASPRRSAASPSAARCSPRPAPSPRRRRLPDPCPPAVPGTAVLLLRRGRAGATTRRTPSPRELRELADAGVQLPPETMRPFIFASEKSRYRAVGVSPARDTCAASSPRRLADRSSRTCFRRRRRSRGATTPRVLDDGAGDRRRTRLREIVVAALTAARRRRHARARRRVDAMRPRAAGIEVAYSRAAVVVGRARRARSPTRIRRPLRRRPPATRRRARRARTAAGARRASTRCAPSRRRTSSSGYARCCVERGFDEARVRLGWAEWQEPGVTEVVRHLAALGCRRVARRPSVDAVRDARHAHRHPGRRRAGARRGRVRGRRCCPRGATTRWWPTRSRSRCARRPSEPTG